jgi:hypothetical protein
MTMIIKMRPFLFLTYLVLNVLINNFFTPECFAYTDKQDEWSYTMADFNGDGSQDVLVASGTGKGNQVWFNNGIGEFYPSDQVIGYSNASDLVVADLDNDNDADIFIANIDSPNLVWLNDGAGNFIANGNQFGNHRSVCASLSDLDSDGDKDAVVAYADGKVEIFSNNGSGFFGSIQTIDGEKGITSIEFKDINNDKMDDIVCFRNGQATAAFINYGNSRFAPYNAKIEIASSILGANNDLTGDGKPDGIFINNEGTPSPANYYGNHPLLGATGGPDSYGYVWVDTPYAWESAGSTNWVPQNEDEVSAAIPLGFTFNFYGTDYTSVYIATDGYIQFSEPFASTNVIWPWETRTTAEPNSAAYGFGTDLDPVSKGSIWYHTLGSAPNRYFVVTYFDIFTAGDNNLNKFQIVIYETTNQIKFNYAFVTPDYGYASIGIESPGGTDRLLRCGLFCFPPDGSSLLFYVAPEIELYRGLLLDMPTNSSYNFGRIAIGGNSSITFAIINTGRSVLNLNGISITGVNSNQYTISSFPSSIPTTISPLGGFANVTVRFQPTVEGVMIARLEIDNDDPNENPYIIHLYGGGDDNAPTVSITNPADGSTVTGTANITATATDDIGINRVEFYRDNTLIGNDSSYPYEITYNFASIPPGTYLIKVIAFDSLGQTAVDAIKVANSDNRPTVNITNPANGAKVFGVVTIKADATDFLGIKNVKFYINDALKCTDTTAPYECQWDTNLLQFGSYTIRAIAEDTSAQTTSDQIIVTTTDSPPSVKITEPTSSSNIFGVTVIKADAWDNIKVAKVDFYVNGSLICSDTDVSYECSWDALMVPVGIYTIKAVATDNLKQTGTDQITVQRRVQVNLSAMRKTEKAWIIKKDYAEILVTLPDYGVADVSRMHILRSIENGSFEIVKDILAGDLQNNTFQFIDKYLDSNKSYTYKVIVIDSNWQPIGESNLTTI